MPRTRLRLVALAVAAVFVTLLAITGVVGLVAGPPEAEPTSPPAVEPSVPSPPETEADGDEQTLPTTGDPIRYARAVARALYEWDTAQSNPASVTGLLMADGDPTGYELAGLAADLRLHLPTADQWMQLREFETVQGLRIDGAFVPDSWTKIARDAGDELVPGTVAVTITGTRLRAGVWQGDEVTAEHPITFTIFVACSPESDRCHLLRLSLPGEALE